MIPRAEGASARRRAGERFTDESKPYMGVRYSSGSLHNGVTVVNDQVPYILESRKKIY